MDFKDEIKQIAERITNLKDKIQTEEATKNAFIMPFLKALGYDVFNPLEVVPEYVTDIGTKKGEKIDYAIFKDGEPAILVECKHWGQNLNLHDGQLLRYFHVSKAKFGILTNGIEYRFYSDLEVPNKMDEKPFLCFKITEIKDEQLEELKKFHKSNFDINNIIGTASELKYTNELRALIQNELSNPSPEFVKYFAKQVHSSSVTTKVIEQFTNLIKKSAQQYVSDLITERLNAALAKESKTENDPSKQSKKLSEEERKVVTTEEELEAFMIVKSILRQKIDSKRIHHRDSQSYFVIMLDDNNRKSICRLYLSGKKKFMITFDEQKKEVRNDLETIDDIFGFAEVLMRSVDSYAN